MNEEQLRELLQTADDSAPQPRVQAGLTARVRQRARGRRRLRAAGGTAAVVVLMLMGTIAFLGRYGFSPRQNVLKGDPGRKSGDAQAPPLDVVSLRAQYARLEAEAQQHQLTAAAMLRLEARTRREQRAADAATWAQAILARPDALEEVSSCRDRTARLLVGRGDILMRQPGGDRAAAESYKNVIDLFPETPEANVARDRLGRIKA